MDLTARINISIAEANNYTIMGPWSSSERYYLTGVGIPVTTVADGTSAGFSVYSLVVKESTIGASPAGDGVHEWRLMESVEFIYMLNAYIEKLQAQIVTANYIQALNIAANRLIAKNTSGQMMASVNYNGFGEYIQYYESGNKKMEFNNGFILYYNDDAENTIAWELGSAGEINKTALDRWEEVWLLHYNFEDDIKTTSYLTGSKYYMFRPGALSVYTAYAGLTVNTPSIPTLTPDNISASDFIAGAMYTPQGLPEQVETSSGIIAWMRKSFSYRNGYVSTEGEVTWSNIDI